jgi:hypothetical protein
MRSAHQGVRVASLRQCQLCQSGQMMLMLVCLWLYVNCFFGLGSNISSFVVLDICLGGPEARLWVDAITSEHCLCKVPDL